MRRWPAEQDRDNGRCRSARPPLLYVDRYMGPHTGPHKGRLMDQSMGRSMVRFGSRFWYQERAMRLDLEKAAHTIGADGVGL